MNVGMHAGAGGRIGINAKTECIEEVTGIFGGDRLLTDGQVVSEPRIARVASRSDINDEIAPEPDDVVFVVPVATIVQRKADFAGALIGSQGGVSKCITIVPNLHLLDSVEVVAAV